MIKGTSVYAVFFTKTVYRYSRQTRPYFTFADKESYVAPSEAIPLKLHQKLFLYVYAYMLHKLVFVVLCFQLYGLLHGHSLTSSLDLKVWRGGADSDAATRGVDLFSTSIQLKNLAERQKLNDELCSSILFMSINLSCVVYSEATQLLSPKRKDERSSSNFPMSFFVSQPGTSKFRQRKPEERGCGHT